MESITLFWIVLAAVVLFVIGQMMMFWDAKPKYPKAYLERKQHEEEERAKEKEEQKKRRTAFAKTRLSLIHI